MELDGLHKSQLAVLGQILGASGMDPSRFEWGEPPYHFAGYSSAPALVHKPSGFWFGIGRNHELSRYGSRIVENGRLVAFSPGEDQDVDRHARLRWPDVESHFRNWLRYVRRELEAPDFWDAVASVGGRPVGDDVLSEPFTPDEQRIVEDRLSGIEQRLEAIETIERKQLAFIKAEFGEVRTQLTRMKRGQWFKFFLGTLANFGLSKALSPDVLRQLVEFAQVMIVSIGSHVLPPTF